MYSIIVIARIPTDSKSYTTCNIWHKMTTDSLDQAINEAKHYNDRYQSDPDCQDFEVMIRINNQKG